MQTVKNAETAKAIIVSPDFKTYSMADRYRELQSRTGIDFSPAIRVLECLPVFMDGEDHQKMRKAMAKQVSRTRECQLAAVRQSFQDLFHRAFRPATEMDLVAGFAQPLWRSISASIVPGNAEQHELVDDIPNLFSPLLSIRERAKINDRIGHFLRNTTEEEDEDERLILLCLASLGARPFVGSLSLSLYELFRSHPNARMSEIKWPQLFPTSSLTYVDRICANASEYAGRNFHEGERVRCFTQNASYSTGDNKQALFGFGAHTCLGKSISERVWSLVVEAFSRSELRVECLGIVMSPHDDPFQMPATIEIRLH